MTSKLPNHAFDREQHFSKLHADEFRHLARQKLFHPADDEMGDFLFNPGLRDWVSGQATIPAAVLMAFVPREDALSVILTKRTDKMKSHSGQIAFAGGKIDKGDASAVDAALREAQEEIGLDPGKVEIIGVMPEYLTGSGFRISPVVAMVEPDAQLAANPDEVEYIFEVPFGFLMNEDNHRTGSRIFRGARRYYLEMPYGEHFIWGVTAGIIRVLHDRLLVEAS
jgi:8-oxo-dGTP pyrophosphatase MutT (NUDIX family)